MKFTLYALAFLISSTTFASDTPAYMKDAVITVTLKDGKQYTFSGNEYKVVSRASKPVVKQEAPTRTPVPTKPVDDVGPTNSRNIISLEAVMSQRGQKVTNSASQVEVETKNDLGFGLQYQRRVFQESYLGVRVDTNGGAGVNVGVGF